MSNTMVQYNLDLESLMIRVDEQSVRDSVGDHVWFNWHRVWYWNDNVIDKTWIERNIKGNYISRKYCWFFASADDCCLFKLTYC